MQVSAEAPLVPGHQHSCMSSIHSTEAISGHALEPVEVS